MAGLLRPAIFIYNECQKLTYRAKHNPEKFFGGGFRYSDLPGKPFEEVVKCFDLRVKSWFLDRVKRPARGAWFWRMLERFGLRWPHGFQITATCCIVIDLLCQYKHDLLSSRREKYIAYLEELHPNFKQSINPPINSIDFRNGQPKQISSLAEAFYFGFRCGVVHNASIINYGRISGPDKVPEVIQLRQWGAHGENREVGVCPEILLECVTEKHNCYIQDLLNKTNSELRQNFASKFERDFGITLSP